MKITAKIIDIVSSVFTIAVLLFAAVLVLPRIFGITPYIVLSGSMEPEIRTGSIAYINTNETEIEVGDIISYQASDGETIVTHRVYSIEEDGYITKGDANEETDLGTISEEQIIGTCSFSIPYLGYLVAGIESREITIFGIDTYLGIVLLVFLVIALNILSLSLNSLAEDDEKDKEINWDEEDDDLAIIDDDWQEEYAL